MAATTTSVTYENGDRAWDASAYDFTRKIVPKAQRTAENLDGAWRLSKFVLNKTKTEVLERDRICIQDPQLADLIEICQQAVGPSPPDFSSSHNGEDLAAAGYFLRVVERVNCDDGDLSELVEFVTPLAFPFVERVVRATNPDAVLSDIWSEIQDLIYLDDCGFQLLQLILTSIALGPYLVFLDSKKPDGELKEILEEVSTEAAPALFGDLTRYRDWLKSCTVGIKATVGIDAPVDLARFHEWRESCTAKTEATVGIEIAAEA